ncbi:hypothetical protein HELRODRAFT_182797 [Helobdella robusta]|uniref:Uncharacterized protein n=1 Tax=Helobdella robusta TaxID=6412 RepID=T1FIR5_HELRO|nr:hypothetical protein HELRODRAFT_182797 [Helobdella robusta]ESN90103.1 hypothetical protein HELRODRAFT_182797 [Helobdella robusta]
MFIYYKWVVIGFRTSEDLEENRLSITKSTLLFKASKVAFHAFRQTNRQTDRQPNKCIVTYEFCLQTSGHVLNVMRGSSCICTDPKQHKQKTARRIIREFVRSRDGTIGQAALKINDGREIIIESSTQLALNAQRSHRNSEQEVRQGAAASNKIVHHLKTFHVARWREIVGKCRKNILVTFFHCIPRMEVASFLRFRKHLFFSEFTTISFQVDIGNRREAEKMQLLNNHKTKTMRKKETSQHCKEDTFNNTRAQDHVLCISLNLWPLFALKSFILRSLMLDILQVFFLLHVLLVMLLCLCFQRFFQTLEKFDTTHSRKELQKRNLDSIEVKAVLVNRLRNALIKEEIDPDEFDFPDPVEQQFVEMNRKFDQQAEKLNKVAQELNDKMDQQSKQKFQNETKRWV